MVGFYFKQLVSLDCWDYCMLDGNLKREINDLVSNTSRLYMGLVREGE